MGYWCSGNTSACLNKLGSTTHTVFMPWKNKETWQAWAEQNRQPRKLYQHAWYLKNRERLLKAANERRREIKKWFHAYKSKLSCANCGFNKHIAALDFHHVNKEEKEHCIAEIVCRAPSKETILKEIAKCKVLCANCHRIEHAEN